MAYVAQTLPAAGRTLYLTVRTATRNPLLAQYRRQSCTWSSRSRLEACTWMSAPGGW